MIFGIVLMAIGALLFLSKLFIQTSKNVGRDDNSVHVGGDNSGLINTGNINSNNNASSHSHTITIIACITEVIGIIITLWNAYHMLSN